MAFDDFQNPYFRFQNIFSPNQVDDSGYDSNFIRRAMGGAFSDYNVDSPDDIDRKERQRQAKLHQYKPGPALQSYLDYSKQAPDRANYKPSRWATVAATLAGAATGYKNPGEGIKLASSMREEPYNRAETDFESNLKAKHDAAALEAQSENYAALSGYRNTNAETAGFKADDQRDYNMVRGKNAADANTIKSGWNLAKIDQFGKTNAQKRAELDERIRNDEANNAIGKTNAGANVTRAGAAVTTAGAAVTNAETNKAREKTNEKDVDSKIITRKNKPNTTKPKLPNESQRLAATRNANQEIAAENPEKFGKFIDSHGNTVPPRSWISGSPTSNPDFAAFLKAREERKAKNIAKDFPDSVAPSSTPSNDGVIDEVIPEEQ